VRDWPLALCDASTVDPENVQPGDLVYGDYVVENCQVHESPSQKWYYLRDQGPEEAWVFVQSDSASLRPGKFESSCSEFPIGFRVRVLHMLTCQVTGVPHSSFPNPLASKDDNPRESIEVRALVYY